MRTDAYFSPDRKHRYWLIRVWDESLPIVANIGVNPSTANETALFGEVQRDEDKIGALKREIICEVELEASTTWA